MWSQRDSFAFNWIGASFNLSEPKGGIRERFFRAVGEAQKATTAPLQPNIISWVCRKLQWLKGQ